MTTTADAAPAQADLEAFLGRFVGDLGAALAGANIVLGDRLGLYTALAANQPATPAEVASATGTDERYVREWLCGQAAGGYVEYDAGTGTFSMTAAQAACLADPASPTYVPGAFQIAASLYQDGERIRESFRGGAGVGWHEHANDLFEGTERFFRPGYVANLNESWLPALDGVESKLLSGATVADVGCGHGASTIIMAQAFPRSTFVGFDYHAPSIEKARAAAVAAGVDDRVRFEVAGAADFSGANYDLVAMFDCLHDMGDPVGAAAHVRAALDADGTWLIVEPQAGDRIEDNLNPVGRVFFSASTMICVPASRSQDVGLCLGAQAGAARIGAVVREAGFTRFRTATETPFNLVLEARP
jgi:SAM-dependent methyltransferase